MARPDIQPSVRVQIVESLDAWAQAMQRVVQAKAKHAALLARAKDIEEEIREAQNAQSTIRQSIIDALGRGDTNGAY
jgi:chromosome segregation ATPase